MDTEIKKEGKILVIGDAHFKDNLSYSEYVSDQRIPEKKAILDFIVASASDCHSVVFMGDNMNSKNNSAESIREFTEFVERFNNKDVYIILGNHEKRGNGKSALDFMMEINKPNWHVMSVPTTKTIEGEKVSFLPYMSRVELGANTDEEATQTIMRGLEGGTFLFAHHVISDTMGNAYGMSTNEFKEVILPKDEVERRYKLVVAGHIHVPQQKGRTIITGSVFTHDTGEKEKFIWKLGTKTQSVEKIKLPCREIHKLENPTHEQLEKIDPSSIVKVVITVKGLEIEVLKKYLSRFDAFLLLEQYPSERTKVHFEEGALDLTVPSLLKIYAEQKGIDLDKLMEGYSMIQS